MQAFEFNADVNDGIIKLPDEYKGKVKSRVKIIILQNELDEQVNLDKQNNKLTNFLNFVEKHRIDLPPDFKFDREEANER